MSAQDGTAPGRRVLVVDDSADTARMMKVLLGRAGFRVRTALDGAEGLAAAADFRPEIVLLDLTLPDRSGEEIAAELRRDAALAGALIIAVSGSGNPACPPPGFDHLLVKPVDPGALLERIGPAAGPTRASA